jgi:hypothetical protein
MNMDLQTEVLAQHVEVRAVPVSPAAARPPVQIAKEHIPKGEVPLFGSVPQTIATINSPRFIDGNSNSVYDLQLFNGALYIADYRNNQILEVSTSSGNQRKVLTTVFHPHGLLATNDKLYIASHRHGQRVEAYAWSGDKSIPARGQGMSAVSLAKAWNRLFFVDDGVRPGLYELSASGTGFNALANPKVAELRPHCVRYHAGWDRLIVTNRGAPALFIYTKSLVEPEVHPLVGMDPLCAVPVGEYLFVVDYKGHLIHILDHKLAVRLRVELTDNRSAITNLVADENALYLSEEGGNRILAVPRKPIFKQLESKKLLK